MKFEIGETATANATAKANADPSPLKGIRDDNVGLIGAAKIRRETRSAPQFVCSGSLAGLNGKMAAQFA